MWVTAGEWMALSTSRSRFAHHLVVRVPLSSRHSVALAPARKPEDPLVEPFATVAERLLYCRVRPGDEAVE